MINIRLTSDQLSLINISLIRMISLIEDQRDELDNPTPEVLDVIEDNLMGLEIITVYLKKKLEDYNES